MIKTNNQMKNRRYLTGFSLAGSLIIILFFAFINFSTGVRFPWFIFPAYMVLWWPIITIFVGKHSMKMLSLVGSLVTIALLVVINYLTSWSYPWFLYPSFAILWWPLSVLFANSSTIKGYSVLGALINVSFFTIINITNSPDCPWALLTYFPVLMWPVGVLLGRRLGKLSIASIICFFGIIYYVVLNIFVFKGFPWAIFPAYALLWWPLAIAFAKRGCSLIFSVIGTLMTAALFITVNIFASPHSIWAVYPIFVILWWPLSIYYFVYPYRKSGSTI
ncbi:MAG: hypothetical protein ACERKN_11255 [Velocimicrobium sp.]